MLAYRRHRSSPYELPHAGTCGQLNFTVIARLPRTPSIFRLLAGLATAHTSQRTFLLRADTTRKAAIARAVSHPAASYREPVRLEESLALAKNKLQQTSYYDKNGVR